MRIEEFKEIPEGPEFIWVRYQLDMGIGNAKFTHAKIANSLGICDPQHQGNKPVVSDGGVMSLEPDGSFFIRDYYTKSAIMLRVLQAGQDLDDFDERIDAKRQAKILERRLSAQLIAIRSGRLVTIELPDESRELFYPQPDMRTIFSTE